MIVVFSVLFMDAYAYICVYIYIYIYIYIDCFGDSIEKSTINVVAIHFTSVQCRYNTMTIVYLVHVIRLSMDLLLTLRRAMSVAMFLYMCLKLNVNR